MQSANAHIKSGAGLMHNVHIQVSTIYDTKPNGKRAQVVEVVVGI